MGHRFVGLRAYTVKRMGSRLALVFFVTVGFAAAGCGRSSSNRDAKGDAVPDGKSERSEGGGPASDVAPELGGSDLVPDVADDVSVDVPPDAQADRADGGSPDMHETPDVGLPEAGQDMVADRQQPEVGQDLASDRAAPEVGQDGPSEARPDVTSDLRSDLASDRGPDADPNCGTPWDVRHCGTCDHDCTKLPHVNTSIESLSCRNGVCNADFCELGYAHCSASTQGDKGCETDLWNDVNNCGACRMKCGQAGGTGVCHRGACVGECPAGRGDCSEDFGCETQLSTPEHCGACGQPACRLANVIAPCRQPGAAQCNDGICAPSYGNCDRTTNDCEAAYGSSAGTCLPTYKGTQWLPTGLGGVTAVRADGARFIGGQFDDRIDFDFTTGGDLISPPEAAGSPYVTMVKADGGYGWTRTFRATGAVTALAAAGDGGVIVAGSFKGTIVLNPDGTGGTTSNPTDSSFVVKLNASGVYVWGFVMATNTFPADITFQSLAVAGDGSIYAAGTVWGGVDFDPGPGAVSRLGAYNGSAFVLKLTKDRGFLWVDTWDADVASCIVYPGRLAASPVGVWMTGIFGGGCDFDPGSGVDRKEVTTFSGFVVGVDAAGRYVGGGVFGIGGAADVAADNQGAVYVVGQYNGAVDFDPGSAEVVRASTDYPSSYVVKLSAGGVFQWVITPTRFSANAIALGRDGGLLVAGMLGADGAGGAAVVEVFPDQSLGWTVGFGSQNMRIGSLASTPTGFFVGGTAVWDTDMDPGVGVDPVSGGGEGNPFISEYAF